MEEVHLEMMQIWVLVEKALFCVVSSDFVT